MSQKSLKKEELLLSSEEENKRLIDICTRKLEKEPNSKKALLLRSNLYIKTSQLISAEKDLTTLINDSLLGSTACYLLGIIYKKQNNLEKSKQYLTISIQKDSNNVNALFLRGAILNLQGKFQEAINDYYLALEKDSLKNTRKNIYKNIEKILGSNGFEENNESISTNQHESVSSKTNGTNTDLDYEINKNLNAILRKTSTLSPVLKSQSDLLKLTDRNNNIETRRFLKDIDKYFYEKEEKDNDEYNYLNTIRSYKIKSKYGSSIGLDNLSDSIGSNFSASKMSYWNLNSQLDDAITHKYSNTNNININDNLNFDKENKEDPIINISVASISSSSSNEENVTPPLTSGRSDECEVYQAQGVVARKMGNFKLAIEQYTKAIDINPNYFKAYFNRAFAYDKIAQFDKAIEDYTKAIMIKPEYPYTYYNRGITFDKINKIYYLFVTGIL